MPTGKMTEGGHGMVLRPEVLSDRSFLFELFASSHLQELEGFPWDQERKTSFLCMQFRAQNGQFRHSHYDADYRIVEIDGQAAGRLVVDRSSKEHRLVDLALLPQFCHRGLGERLVRGLIRDAARKGVVLRTSLETRNFAALRLFERLGFVKADDLDVHVVMEYRLNDAA
jgi:ribosomal protein S18 acetylase RimI-like enzyme